jgi:hypothetical protein
MFCIEIQSKELAEEEATVVEGEEKNKDADRVIPFRVITGGKGPPGNPWLATIPVKTLFLAKHKQTGKINAFEVVWRGRDVTLLKVYIHLYLKDDKEDEYEGIFEDTVLFSIQWSFLEVIDV